MLIRLDGLGSLSSGVIKCVRASSGSSRCRSMPLASFSSWSVSGELERNVVEVSSSFSRFTDHLAIVIGLRDVLNCRL